MHIPLPIIPNHRPRPLPILFVSLNLNPQAAIHLQPQQHLIIHRISSPALLRALHALQLQLLQPRRQVGRLLRQSLGLHLGVGRRLGNAELVRVEARNGRRVVGKGVRRDQLAVLRVDRVELARELLERRVGVADVQLARLLQRRERFADAPDGELVGLDVEVVDGVVDEL